jgi:drug/metabolite transporter (DMT)-like permease
MKQKGTLLKGYLFVIASAVIFGCMPLMTKRMYADGMNSMSVVLLRNFLSLPLLGILGWKQTGNLKIRKEALPTIMLLALLGCSATPLLLFSSYQYISSGTATVFHFVYPAMVILLGMIFLKRKSTWQQLLCVVICVAGIALFYDPAQKLDLTGSVIALLSGVTYAGYILMLSVFRFKELSGFKLNFFVASGASLILLLVCVVGKMITLPTSVMGWVCAFALAMAVNGGAVVLFQQGTFLIGGERASILSTFEPITGVVVGILAFQETVGPGMLVGTVLVILASILIAVFDMKKEG